MRKLAVSYTHLDVYKRQELPQTAMKDLIKTLNVTKKMLTKINSLREQDVYKRQE